MGHMHDKKERIAMLDIKKEYSLAYRFKTDRSYENYWKEQSELYDICIWGMGNLGKIICQWFQDNEIPIKYFCDNENEKHGETFQGVKCVSYERIAEFKDGLYVIIAVENAQACYAINEQIKDFPRVYHNPLGISAYMLQIFDVDKERFEIWYKKSYDLLADRQSKDVYKALLELRLQSEIRDYEPNYMEKYYSKHQYIVEDIIDYSKVETVIDCGAFIGDSLEEFIHFNIGNEFHCFEMDSDVYRVLENNIHTKFEGKGRKIVPYLYGVGDTNETITYISDQTGASRICTEGNQSSKIVSLDNMFVEKKVDLIKMDIEGAEEAALHGATLVIQKNHPILAISMYHNYKQFSIMPYLIHSIFTGYKIYIRHHKNTLDDTGCYAVYEQES